MHILKRNILKVYKFSGASPCILAICSSAFICSTMCVSKLALICASVIPRFLFLATTTVMVMMQTSRSVPAIAPPVIMYAVNDLDGSGYWRQPENIQFKQICQLDSSSSTICCKEKSHNRVYNQTMELKCPCRYMANGAFYMG